MPDIIMQVFFVFSLAEALAASTDLDTLSVFSFAILVRLGFHCLLRPAEILKLTAGDIRMPVSAYEPRRADQAFGPKEQEFIRPFSIRHGRR